MSLNLDKNTWKRVAFGDVIQNVTDRINPVDAEVERYVGLEHLDPRVMTVQRWDSPDVVEGQKLRFQSGDVIFGRRRAYQKKVALAEFEGICSAHALVLRAREDYVHREFLPVFLSSDYFLDRAIGISVGSLSPTVNWRDLRVQEFDLPPLDEQKRIAGLLWAVEHDRSATQSLGEAVALALKADADRLMLEIEARDGTQPLPDLVRDPITDGVREKGPDVEGGVPYIRVSDMTKPRLRRAGMKRTSPELAAGNTSSEMHTGDIVLALRSKIGLCHVVPPDLDGCNIAQGVGKLAPAPAIVRADYMYEALMAPRTQEALERVAKGTTIREVSLKALRAFAIPVPRSLEEQLVVVRHLQAVRRAHSAATAKGAALTTLRSAFLADIFGGQ